MPYHAGLAQTHGWLYLPSHEVSFGKMGHVGLVITRGTRSQQAETVRSNTRVHKPPTRWTLPAQPGPACLTQFLYAVSQLANVTGEMIPPVPVVDSPRQPGGSVATPHEDRAQRVARQ